MQVTIDGIVYRVKWFHRRKFIPVTRETGFDRERHCPIYTTSAVLAARGGVTECVIERPDGAGTVGFSLCSEKDNYNKDTGRKLSMADALRDSQYPHLPFWDKYNKTIGV